MRGRKRVYIVSDTLHNCMIHDEIMQSRKFIIPSFKRDNTIQNPCARARMQNCIRQRFSFSFLFFLLYHGIYIQWLLLRSLLFLFLHVNCFQNYGVGLKKNSLLYLPYLWDQLRKRGVCELTGISVFWLHNFFVPSGNKVLSTLLYPSVQYHFLWYHVVVMFLICWKIFFLADRWTLIYLAVSLCSRYFPPPQKKNQLN